MSSDHSSQNLSVLSDASQSNADHSSLQAKQFSLASDAMKNTLPVMQTLEHWLNSHKPLKGCQQPLYIAYSGGMDSSVLLHALHQLIYVQSDLSKQFSLTVLHINHNLQAEANDWQQFCQQQVRQLSVAFQTKKLQLDSFKRQGIEAVARKARYQALTEMVASDFKARGSLKSLAAPVLLFAHHQRDQAETVLLNLFRGAGVPGMSGMPESRALECYECLNDNLILHRPLLKVSYQAMLDYAKSVELSFIEDPSNQDNQFRRNWLRNNLLPDIEKLWPDVQQKVSDSAGHISEANLLLDKMAQSGLESSCFSFDFIELRALEEVDWIEQKNIIRYWLSVFFPGVVLSKKHYQWLYVLVFSLQGDNRVQNAAYKMRSYELRWQYQRLYILPKWFTEHNEQAAKDYCRGIEWASIAKLKSNIDSSGLQGRVINPGYTFKFNVVHAKAGLVCKPIAHLDEGAVNKKALKNFFQQHRIPPWLRVFWPVLQDDEGRILAVLGCQNCLQNLSPTEKSQVEPRTLEMSYLQILQILQLR
ncbi:tRNA lysidine(34) synthetase TilS [Thiomicrorhabdus sediminis]|uniref:tRNA(Ile)-lysidine synthase n=1 Tax=Thiomicrorhabdus sediminis TaxID=2580412 RepID=A0A4V1HHT8_9GAMM|nr:tRNA lysidine(34) synthetase TilS [Thiomicrorhabdus sediminis]QCU90173.1 tRNA lysidine(34) synthetase TilS [Thiomicrorhabdus sediminis]